MCYDSFMEIPWSKIDRTKDCWNWKGALSGGGYGQVHLKDNKTVRAHRLTYELLVGPIPAGLQLDHLCRNRKCVNPKHLEPVTRRVNILRGVGASAQNAKRTLCKNGHPLNEENTFWRKGKWGEPWRQCIPCRRDVARTWARKETSKQARKVYRKALLTLHI